MRALKIVLERLYREYDFEERVKHDPIRFPGRYEKPDDIETAGFIASSFAYGKAAFFGGVIERILAPMGGSPHAFLHDFSLKKKNRFAGIRYRFNTNDDILCFLFLLHRIIATYGDLRTLFRSFFLPSHDIRTGLEGFVEAFLDGSTAPVYGDDVRPPGLLQLFPSPVTGSACKRQNLFLRWMVRDRDVDFGIWKGIDRSRLIIPLDTHIAKISACLGLTQRKSQDWKMAAEITASLRALDPGDPLKYDFALCHTGISGLCRGGKDTKRCEECVFRRPSRELWRG